MSLKRIAYCSPVNPLPSGISDYTEELLPFLGQYAEIVLCVPPGTAPSNGRLLDHLDVCSVEDLPRRHAADAFDAIIYHMGNSPVHAEIYTLAQRLPGVVVLHEWVFHHFKLWYHANRGRGISAYLDEMQRRYGQRGLEVGRRMAGGQLLDAAFDMPLVEDVVDSAAGIIAHSRWVSDRVGRVRSDAPVAVVPMGVPLPVALPRRTARGALGLPLDAPIWASFGHVNPYKRLEVALRAFRSFHTRVPSSCYLLVGSVSPSYDLIGLVRSLGLEQAVHLLGHVPAELFNLYVAASDLCLNLRSPTAGETSASSLRLLAAGRPTVVSAVGALAEFPDGVVGKIDPGIGERAHIQALGYLVHASPVLARRWGDNAREYVATHHTLESAAEGYMRFLARLYGWPRPEPQRDVLWTSPPLLVNTPAASGFEPNRQADPAAARPLPEAVHSLASELGRTLGELGVEPHDIATMSMFADDIVDTWPSSIPEGLRDSPDR